MPTATIDITSIAVKAIRLAFTPLNFRGDPIPPGEHPAAASETRATGVTPL